MDRGDAQRKDARAHCVHGLRSLFARRQPLGGILESALIMPEATLLAVFLAGLFGGGHCAAMCGGIVGALAAQRGAKLSFHLAYNAGRVGSYLVAGAIAGAIGGMILLTEVLSIRIAMYIVANVLLALMGLYL